MPWNSQGGGWQGGGNGGGGGGNRGPWGQGPSGGGGGGGPQKPDLEDMIRKGQDTLKQFTPGSGGGFSRPLIALAVIGVLAFLIGRDSYYVVQPSQQGVVLRFGEFVRTDGSGFNLKLPFVETALTPEVTRVQQTDIGFRRVGQDRRNDIKDESLMLTGDENIVDIDFSVQWIIADASKFLFQIENPPQTLKVVAESAMREVIGQTDIQAMLTTDKGRIESKVRALVQSTLDDYDAGIAIQGVKLQQVDPPSNVIDAFRDVQRAKADRGGRRTRQMPTPTPLFRSRVVKPRRCWKRRKPTNSRRSLKLKVRPAAMQPSPTNSAVIRR